ncbi:MAG: hypothetical protein WDO16_21005 [Bacteroidota bacterium]
MQKRSILLSFITIILLNSCSLKKDNAALPAPPASVKAVLDGVKGSKYITEKAGTNSPFKDDKTIQWLEPKKENEFEKKIVDEAKTLQLNFTNNTAVIVSAKDKTYNGTYRADDIQKEDEEPGIKLRISYIDEEFKFGDGPATEVTYTYFVEGIDDKGLLLLTPRSMNNRKIVVLMKKQ